MREALKLALDALELTTTAMLRVRDELAERGARPITNKHHQALWDLSFAAYTDHALPSATAIKEALAQPEQDPVAWMTINEYGEEDDIHYENPEGHLLEGWTYKPLYTTPQLTQAQDEPLEYWNAVEGWVKIEEVRKHFGSVGCGTIYKNPGEDRVPMYITPPKRPWVGLTEEEIDELIPNADGTAEANKVRVKDGDIPYCEYDEVDAWSKPLVTQIARAIEAKLKEKNQ